MENKIYVPYVMVCTSTTINNEVVWYKNKWKNLLLKIKRYFFLNLKISKIGKSIKISKLIQNIIKK
jgi:hypothetical protein